MVNKEELKNIAWNNALNFEIDNPNQFKVCYICYGDFLLEKLNKKEVTMNFNEFEDDNELNGWCIDFVDGNKKNLINNNIVAVHCDCHKLKKHQDFSRLFKEYKDSIKK